MSAVERNRKYRQSEKGKVKRRAYYLAHKVYAQAGWQKQAFGRVTCIRGHNTEVSGRTKTRNCEVCKEEDRQNKAEAVRSKATRHYYDWTVREIDYLLSNHGRFTFYEIAEHLGRSRDGVTGMFTRLRRGTFPKKCGEITAVKDMWIL